MNFELTWPWPWPWNQQLGMAAKWACMLGGTCGIGQRQNECTCSVDLALSRSELWFQHGWSLSKNKWNIVLHFWEWYWYDPTGKFSNRVCLSLYSVESLQCCCHTITCLCLKLFRSLAMFTLLSLPWDPYKLCWK